MSKLTKRQTRILADVLNDLREVRPDALACRASVQAPDSEDSCGATFLINVRIRVVEAVWGYLTGVDLPTGRNWSTHLPRHGATNDLGWLGEGRRIQEIANDAIPTDDADVCWLILADLNPWDVRFPWTLKWPELERMTPLCKAALTVIAYTLAVDLVEDVIKMLNERDFAEAGKDEVEA